MGAAIMAALLALTAAVLAAPATDAVELFADGAMSVATASQEFGVPRSTLYELMQSGRLPYAQLGRKRFIARRALAELMARATVGFEPQTAGK